MPAAPMGSPVLAMAKKDKNTGFQQAAGLIRYFDAEEETAIHIDPRVVLAMAFLSAVVVLVLNVVIPVS